jgi:hypothetical protein
VSDEAFNTVLRAAMVLLEQYGKEHLIQQLWEVRDQAPEVIQRRLDSIRYVIKIHDRDVPPQLARAFERIEWQLQDMARP